MGKKDEKTNVMRILEQKKISYQSYNYLNTGAVSGVEESGCCFQNAGHRGKVRRSLRVRYSCGKRTEPEESS